MGRGADLSTVYVPVQVATTVTARGRTEGTGPGWRSWCGQRTRHAAEACTACTTIVLGAIGRAVAVRRPRRGRRGGQAPVPTGAAAPTRSDRPSSATST